VPSIRRVFDVRRIPALAVGTWTRWSAHDGWMSTAALAFHATLALIPCCLVLIAFLGKALASTGATTQAAEALVDLFETDVSLFVAQQIETVLENVRDHAGGGGLFGLGALLIAALGMFAQLDEAFAKVWDAPLPQTSGWWSVVRGTLRDRLVAAAILLLIAMTFLLLFLTNTLLSTFGERLTAVWSATALRVTGLALGPVLTATLVSVLYRVFSRTKLRWRHAFAAGVTTMIFWEVGRRLLEWLVIGERYSVYGALGALLALMVWIYYACAALLLGAELARSLHEGEGKSTSP
jgi:membrane protein